MARRQKGRQLNRSIKQNKMNHRTTKFLTFACLAAFQAASVADAETSQPPNIVYILADDMGYGDVSALNPESKIITPNLDKMANDGMIFTDAHTNSSVCTPTRYGILTGRYCWRTSLKKSVLRNCANSFVDASTITVASYLKQHGYNTGMVGKWHLDPNPSCKAWVRRIKSRLVKPPG